MVDMMGNFAGQHGKYFSTIVEPGGELQVVFNRNLHVVPLVDNSVMLKGIRLPSQTLHYLTEIILNSPARYVKTLNSFKQYVQNVEKVFEGADVQERKMRQLIIYCNNVDIVETGEVFRKVLTKLLAKKKNKQHQDFLYFKTLLDNSTVETIMSDFMLEHFFLPVKTHHIVKPGKLFKLLSGKFLITTDGENNIHNFGEEKVQNSLLGDVKFVYNPPSMTTMTQPLFVYGAEKYTKMDNVAIHTLKPSSGAEISSHMTVVSLGETKVVTKSAKNVLKEFDVATFPQGGKVTGDCVVVESKSSP